MTIRNRRMKVEGRGQERKREKERKARKQNVVDKTDRRKRRKDLQSVCFDMSISRRRECNG